jgi:hypothetical protein
MFFSPNLFKHGQGLLIVADGFYCKMLLNFTIISASWKG